MTRHRWLVAMVVAACSGNGPSSSGSSDEGTTGVGLTTGVDTATQTTGVGSTTGVATTIQTTGVDSTTDADTTTQTTGVGSTTDMDPTTQTTAVGTETTSGSSGFCMDACMVVADCVPSGASEADWQCTDGFCEYIGEIPPCHPALCDDLMIGVCSLVEGVSLCTTPCTDDSMCLAGFTECTGVDDPGNSICATIPCLGAAEGEPCEIPMFGQLGTCTDGVCSCSSDDECTAEGYACNN